MNTPIICAGFHRSGTSLASQMLHLSGIPFAIENMAGNISNPDGHFEDLASMRLHDDFLSESGCNWKFHDECEINHDVSVVERLTKYIDCRNTLDGPLWLMKDPRATLYLDDWQSALKGKGKFVLMYRHWGLCVQSLLKRHSRDLAHCLPTGKVLSDNIVFWQEPELAARMWLAYNKAMLKFIKANKENCLLVSQPALMQGCDLIAEINNKFKFQIKPLVVSPVKFEYASENVDAIILNGLPTQLQSELNETYEQLAKLCDTSNAQDAPEFVDNPRDDKTISLVIENIKLAAQKANKTEGDKATGFPQVTYLSMDIDQLTFDELSIKLKKLNPLVNKGISKFALPLALKLIELEPFNITGYEWAGRIHSVLGQYEIAELHFVKAIAISNSPPYMRMLLADTYLARYEFKTAEYYYFLALKSDIKNPQFSIKLGDLYLIINEYNKSINNYKAALALDDNDWVRSKLINVIDEFRGTKAAIEYVESGLQVNTSILMQNKLTSLKLKLQTRDAKDCYKVNVKRFITRERINSCLADVASFGLPSNQLVDFSYWFSNNLRDVFSEKELANYFMVQQGDSPSSPKLTIIVISYNMGRELPRTIASLLPPYQKYILESDLEVIVIDNGSEKLPLLSDFPANDNLRIISNSNPGVSPVSAINLGLSVAKGELVGVLIDGARMASPGLYKHVLKASRLTQRAVISTLGFHLGPEVQMTSVPKGYNQDIEDDLLKEIDWFNNGYKLFEISTLAGSSANGYFKPIAESNAIFMSKFLWEELDGYDERFITPGGGFVNLDTYRRACELPNVELVVLLNEGTFHQVHGGVATNLQRADATPKIFSDEYKSIRNKDFSVPHKTPLFLGSYVPEAASFLTYSIQKNIISREIINANRNNINKIIINKSYCNQFLIDDVVSDDVLNSPVIITGRGGSGTRLLSKLMQGIDLFVGNEINKTEDSVEWVAPIYDLITNSISLKNNNFNQLHIDRLRANAKNILYRRSASNAPWGFKLPETMLCLPELLKAFPNAKVIHLVRHPISISFRRSHMTSRLDNPIGRSVLGEAYKALNLDAGTMKTKGDYFNNAVSWVYQLMGALDFIENNLPASNVLQIKYESLANDTDNVLTFICNFLNLPMQQGPKLSVDATRLNMQHDSSPEVDEIWSLCEGVASRIGYSKSLGE